MFFSGFKGFANASVTKVTMILVTTHTLLASMMNIRNTFNLHYTNLQRKQYYKILTKNTAFSNSTTLLTGMILLYQYRILERQRGASKYICYIITITTLTSTLETILLVITNALKIKMFIPSGPYAILAATTYLYYKTIPSSYKIKLIGNSCSCSDKSFIYLIALQLLFLSDNSIYSLCSGIIGVLSGMIYNANIFGLKDWRFPKPVQTLFKKYIAKYIDSSKPRTLYIPTTNSNVPYQVRQQTNQQNNEDDELVQYYVKLLKEMGFTDEEKIKEALNSTNNDLSRATEILLN